MWSRVAEQASWAIRLALESRRAEADAPASRSVGEPGVPVLLLHGLCGTPRMLGPLGRRLRRSLGRPTLDVALGMGFGDVRDTALRVHRLLEERQVSRCDVVGYSLGGVVASYLLKCLDQGRRIGTVVTLGTPHRGVPLVAHWPALVSRWCRAADQLRSDSPLLDQLSRLPLPAAARLISIAGADDTLVPPEAARLEGSGCRNFVVQGIDHFRLLTSRRVSRCVEQGLPSASATPGPSPAFVPRVAPLGPAYAVAAQVPSPR